jgi:cell wall-associated NlpC family hydrolase
MTTTTRSRVVRRASSQVVVLCLAVLASSLTQAPAAVAGPGVDLTAGEAGSGPQDPAVVTHGPQGKFKDVSSSSWAVSAINYVASSHNWMADYGDRFRPNYTETRAYLARALVRAFAPGANIKHANMTFKDLPKKNRFNPFASIAVKHGWMSRSNGKFAPNKAVTMTVVHRALVFALGLQDVVTGLNDIHTADGYRLKHKSSMAPLLLGMQLGLRYNHSTEAMDVDPKTKLPRSEVAYSLWRAYLDKTTYSYKLAAVQRYKTIELPKLTKNMRKVVEFGLRWVGYPYIWGGEWYRKSPSGYCCGFQPRGGFDCSGLSWWLMKRPEAGYNNTHVRKYRGWSLPQRSSATMAAVGKRVNFENASPGDLMFYASGGSTVDHVDVFIGKAWALDSSGGYGGVSIVSLATGSWYRDHFMHGRDITG